MLAQDPIANPCDSHVLGHPWDVANTQYELGLVFAVLKDKDKARQLFEEAPVTFWALRAKPGVKKVKMALEKLT